MECCPRRRPSDCEAQALFGLEDEGHAVLAPRFGALAAVLFSGKGASILMALILKGFTLPWARHTGPQGVAAFSGALTLAKRGSFDGAEGRRCLGEAQGVGT